jgi:hypothetical protein
MIGATRFALVAFAAYAAFGTESAAKTPATDIAPEARLGARLFWETRFAQLSRSTARSKKRFSETLGIRPMAEATEIS